MVDLVHFQEFNNIKSYFMHRNLIRLTLGILMASGATGALSQPFQVSLNDTTLVLSRQDQILFHYRHAELPPPAGESDKWARSGFIHPLYALSGEVLTWAQPPDHLHHMGLWNPWTRVTWTASGGQPVTTDFWNLGDESGTVRFSEVVSTTETSEWAGFTVKHDHLAFVSGADPAIREEIKVLEEQWIITVSDHPKGYLLDFVSLIRNVTGESLSLDAYRYGGGLGYRATSAWNRDNSRVLTSEGRTWADGDATRARWAMVSGKTGGGTAGLLFMSRPSNYDYPQPMRIWPQNSNGGVGHQYFEFTPIREKAWVLEPQKVYSQKYQVLVFTGQLSAAEAEQCWQQYTQPRVLIYTRNGEGFVHDNISASVGMLKGICDRHGIRYQVTDQPNVFTREQLSGFQAVIFSNTNNEAFVTSGQRDAFQEYIQAGGGFVGIHSACGSERDWPWFWKMLGGTFLKHPPYQAFDVQVTDPDHPSTGHLGQVWKWEDEAYYMHHLNPGIRVLLAHDLRTIEDKTRDTFPGTLFGDFFPGAWCQTFDGGVQWYTSYGHSISHYTDPAYVQHVEGGLLWVLDEVNKLNNNL